MHQTRMIITLLALFSLTLFSCHKVVGTGPTVSETRNLSDFSEIRLDMDATLEITQGAHYLVQVDAQSNIMNEIRTTVSGHVLTIDHRHNTWIKSAPITVHVTLPYINALKVSGSGSIQGQTTIQSTNLTLCISGSGEITLPGIETETLESTISGSGEVNLKSGSTTNLESDISGSGDLYCSYVASKYVDARTSGSGTTKVYALNQLDAHISGSGNVYYRGNPIVNSSISGSGKVIHQD